MKVFKTPTVSITTGVLVNLMVIGHLLSVAMEWRADPKPSLLEYLSDPTRLIFIVYITTLLCCIWLIRGKNNRMVYVFWCLGYILHYFLYWLGLELFLYTQPGNKNIYALNWLSTVSIIPLLLFCRYRIYLVIHVLAFMIKFNLCKHSAEQYFQQLRTSDFELKLRRGASIWFIVEFCYAMFLSFFAITKGVAPRGSLWEAMQASGMMDPFPAYYWILDIITIYFIAIILINSSRDFNNPDIRTITALTETQRKKLIKGRKPSKFDPF